LRSAESKSGDVFLLFFIFSFNVHNQLSTYCFVANKSCFSC